MAGNSDRRGSGPLWFLALVVVIFVLYSATVAASTADECGDRDKSWKIFPPEWECESAVGFG